MSDHALLSPSAAHRWLVCPGEPSARATAPWSTSSYADDGTTAHWVGAECLKKKSDPDSFLGQTIPAFDDPLRCLKFTKEMNRGVKKYLADCHPIMAKAKGVFSVEVKGQLPAYSDQLGGTADFIAVAEDTLYVRDYKNGSGVDVAAFDNPQLLIYALIALAKVEAKAPQLAEKITTVDMGIVQPNTSDETKKWIISLDELRSWGETTLRPAIFRAENEPYIRVAGTHCHFCPAKATCPELHALNTQTAMTVFSEISAAPVVPPRPDEIPLDQLVHIWRHKEVMSKWMDGIGAHLYNLACMGQDIPGFKLVQKKANRTWVPGVESAVQSMLGARAWLPPKLISPKKAEDLLDDLLGIKLDQSLVMKPDNGVTLVPLSDRRKPAPAPMAFTSLNDDPGEVIVSEEDDPLA